MTIAERALEYCEAKKLNAVDFEKLSGLSNGMAKKLSDKTRPYTFDRISKAFPDLNINWLKTGEGSMLNELPLAKTVVFEDDRVPLLPVEAIAGLSIGFAEGLNIQDCRMIRSPFPGSEYAIQVSGDSMFPIIKSGDLLYIKKINDKAFIPWGHVVVLDTENGAVVKEIYPCDKEDDYIIAKSINEKYPPYKIEKLAIYGMYKILGTATINSTL